MADAKLRFDECPACSNGVDENDPDRPYTIDQGMTWHLDCHESEQERRGLEAEERARRQHFAGELTQADRDRQDLHDAGRGHLAR